MDDQQQSIGYSKLHDFLASASPEQLRAKLFSMADKQLDLVETIREKQAEIADLKHQLQKLYTQGVLEVEQIRVPAMRRAKLDSGESSWTVFEQSIYQGLFRIMRKKLQTRSATTTDCQWLAAALSQHVYRTLEKFNLVAKENPLA